MQQIDWRQEPGQTTTEGRGKCRPKLGDALTAEEQCTAPWSRSIIAQPLLLACSSEQNILRSQKIIHKETDQKIIYCLEDCRMLLERNNSSSCYNFSTLQDWEKDGLFLGYGNKKITELLKASSRTDFRLPPAPRVPQAVPTWAAVPPSISSSTASTARNGGCKASSRTLKRKLGWLALSGSFHSKKFVWKQKWTSLSKFLLKDAHLRSVVFSMPSTGHSTNQIYSAEMPSMENRVFKGVKIKLFISSP